MSEDFRLELGKKRDISFIHATSFSVLPADSKPVLRSYSDIRKQMHKSLQARLNRDYALAKGSVSYAKADKEAKRLWTSFKKSALVSALANIRVEAKLKTLASRVKPETPLKPQTAFTLNRSNSSDLPPKTRQRSLPSYPMITLKEAMKDREWLCRAKDSILKSVAMLINESNGLIADIRSVETFKYYVKKGNNAKLVSQVMKTRPWWVKVKSKSEANFVWSIKREMDVISSLPSAKPKTLVRVDHSKSTVSCSVKYAPPDSKVGRIVDVRRLGYGSITNSKSYIRIANTVAYTPSELHIHNRLECNFHLTHKKALFHNMKQYYSALGEDYTLYMPMTFHIVQGESDPEFSLFTRSFLAIDQQLGDSESSAIRNLWIVKPGENSNQGRDIVVCSSLDQVRAELKMPVDRKTGQKRTFIIQKYIERPFLYYKRKFDIRCYAMVTAVNGIIQGYFYPEGYLRTSSREFSLKHVWDKFTHLTNDAVQKTSDDYSKFEHGNKVSFSDFQKYLDSHLDSHIKFTDQILPVIKKLVQDSIKATYFKLDPNRRHSTFEILGYDIMLDWRLRPVLIEVNTNPCLALVAPILFRVIPSMLDGAFRIVLDTLFQEWGWGRRNSDALQENRWELIFHELVDGKALLRTLQTMGTLHMLQEMDASIQYDDSGDECDPQEAVGN